MFDTVDHEGVRQSRKITLVEWQKKFLKIFSIISSRKVARLTTIFSACWHRIFSFKDEVFYYLDRFYFELETSHVLNFSGREKKSIDWQMYWLVEESGCVTFHRSSFAVPAARRHPLRWLPRRVPWLISTRYPSTEEEGSLHSLSSDWRRSPPGKLFVSS